MDSSPLRNRLLLAAAAVLFSTGGAAIKAAGLTGWQIASFRSCVAAAVLLALLPAARKHWTWRITPVAAAYAFTLVLFVLATRLTTAANAIFIQSSAPLYLLLFGPWLLREPIRRSDYVYMAALALGMAFFAMGGEAARVTAPDPRTGNIYAAASGLFWAIVLGGLRWMSRHHAGDAGLAVVSAGNVLAFLIALPMALPVTSFALKDAGVILYLGVFQIGLAYWCLTRAIRHVPAFEATTILLLEPALNPIWVWIAHGERPGPLALLGGAVILLATLTNTWRTTRAAA
jgi:drug/metabolite transporter, DME family